MLICRAACPGADVVHRRRCRQSFADCAHLTLGEQQTFSGAEAQACACPTARLSTGMPFPLSSGSPLATPHRPTRMPRGPRRQRGMPHALKPTTVARRARRMRAVRSPTRSPDVVSRAWAMFHRQLLLSAHLDVSGQWRRDYEGSASETCRRSSLHDITLIPTTDGCPLSSAYSTAKATVAPPGPITMSTLCWFAPSLFGTFRKMRRPKEAGKGVSMERRSGRCGKGVADAFRAPAGPRMWLR